MTYPAIRGVKVLRPIVINFGGKRMFKCYQWLLKNNQETCFPAFVLTKRHYTNRADVEKAWCKDICFTAIRPLRESKLTGELALRIYGGERN